MVTEKSCNLWCSFWTFRGGLSKKEGVDFFRDGGWEFSKSDFQVLMKYHIQQKNVNYSINPFNATLFWHQQPRAYIYSRCNICSDQVFIMRIIKWLIYMPMVVCEKHTFVVTEIYMPLAFKGLIMIICFTSLNVSNS